jgi:hypothetical protein
MAYNPYEENQPNPRIEEALNTARELVPRMWWNVYQGCVQAGFDSGQSFTLLQTYILAQNPNGIRPNDPQGPASDKP